MLIILFIVCAKLGRKKFPDLGYYSLFFMTVTRGMATLGGYRIALTEKLREVNLGRVDPSTRDESI